MPMSEAPSRVFSKIGLLEEEGGTRFLRTRKLEAGCVVYGPYEPIGPGRYSVTFDIRPDADADADAICCKIDVATQPHVILSRPISVRELCDNGGMVRVEFEITKPAAAAEYRVHSTGAVGLRVAYDGRAATAIFSNSPGLFFLAEQKPGERAKLVYQQHYPHISYLSQFGLHCEVADRVLATIEDVKVHIDCKEDLQIINEVFLKHDYHFATTKRCIAIDVGMNVGMASLSFANFDNVEVVYGFEPFKAPYLRAMDNLKLNPKLSTKIKAFNFGLAGKFEELDVLAQELATIGTSIRGVGYGRSERIQVRDAGSELKGPIREAKGRGLGVVIKLDCEGSEFAIFESLEREGLFTNIDVVMMEWHKWWSKKLTQRDLIRPLAEAGFIVFDRSNPAGELTGFLLAVKNAFVTGSRAI